MKKVLVIGDSCQDVFRYGKCDRLSPEAPVPIFKPTRITGNGGMAINVCENLKALGVDCDIITNDLRPVKIRYVDEVSNQMLLRVDENDEIIPITDDELHAIDFEKYHAVVISDYNKGYLSADDIKWIAKNHPLTFMDSKKELGSWCDDIKYLKVNQKEYLLNMEYIDNDFDGNYIITKGKDGAGLNGEIHFNITERHIIRDLSGAGDTFFAGLVADFIKNNDIRKAVKFANKCAAWAVSQKGVVTVDLSKIEL